MNTVGLYGLGVMGRSLAKNLLNHGYQVAVSSHRDSTTEDFVKKEQEHYDNMAPYYNIEEFVASLERPRKVILMVTAGKAVDGVIEQMLPYLDENDIIMECGNSYYQDTERRIEELKEKNIRYLGIGVSGGEKGALEGPSIMVGGNTEAYREVGEMLEAIAAKAYDGKSCCAYVGAGGAGHFVKMVHNGIEYAIIQSICEVYDLLRKTYGYTAPEISEIFGELNRGRLNSYLVEISEQICKREDDLREGYLVDQILDKAGQKGTGKWTCREGIEMDVAIPTIQEAVAGRWISSDYATRMELGEQYKEGQCRERLTEDRESILAKAEAAVYMAQLCIYDQAFHLMHEASQRFGWNMDLGEITLIWRNGCIIRARLLDDIFRAVGENGHHLLKNAEFRKYILEQHEKVKVLAADAILHQVSVPCLLSALSYFNEYTDRDSSANLLQAQRDYFGAHTYERKDREGVFHTLWEA